MKPKNMEELQHFFRKHPREYKKFLRKGLALHQLLETATQRDPSLNGKTLNEVSMAELIALNKEPH